MKRYPGIQSYDRDRRHLFFGRERETKELFRLTVLQPIVVLFGKSGTGKTSLIQAGVTPMLHERRLHPVFLRINQTDKPIVQQIHALLEQGEYLPYNTPDKLSLWDYCHRFAYSEAGESFTPLYVFDQFEELFTLYADRPEEQKQFIDQLAQVMNGTAPEGHRRSTPPKAHFLISIRSDYLYLLDRLSDQIPAILSTRYELSDLTIDNARQAIEQPALAQGSFDSPTFSYSLDALQNIMTELSQEQQTNIHTQSREVGGFQLQLLCQRIEEKIIASHADKTHEPYPIITVTTDFYGGTPGIRQIIGEFYNSVLQKYTNANTRRHVQQLIEEGLISNGRRIILEQEYLKQTYQLTQADIDQLTNERLCRKEASSNMWYYEISHDTLLKPIISTYELRRDAEEKMRLAEEKAEAYRKAAEAQAQAEKDRQLRIVAEQAKRRANIFTTIAVIVALLAVGAGWFAYVKQQESEQTLKDLIKTQRQAVAAKIYAVAKNYDELGQNDYACQNYQKVLDTLRQYPQDSLYLSTKKEMQKQCKP
ncbi:MAG: ATP-binding protein [Chitinophagales bacterium]|nr:ATP-binding protein [Chitinophagales bacterium]